MALTTGFRVGTYEICEPIGSGGMGEVYRARDTKLQRYVAMKVLPELFAGDRERLARFEREAQVLASLNHPNIGQIYGVEEAGAIRALVMELVDGATLAELIDRRTAGPRLSIGEAIGMARQIATALEVAHDRGIVHRDLKPANVKVREDGTVKVLDFGLALVSPAGAAGSDAGEATITSPALMTHAGMVVGTAAYMAPEQATGKPVDRRADIWSFGCVLFEMLAGRRPFAGETVTDTLTSILRDAPDWSALPPSTPANVRRLLQRCLEKEPRRRLRDIGDARLELEEPIEAPADAMPVALPHGWRRVPVWTLPAVVAATALAVLAAGLLSTPPVPERSLRRFEIAARDMRPEPERHPVISPDGRHVAWSAGGALWIRDLDRVEPRSLASGADPLHLAWSPDSSQVLFYARNKLWRVRTSGGDPVPIADANFPRGAFTPGGVWLEDGRIVFAPASTGSGLLTVSAHGGAIQTLFEPPPDVADFHSPSALPGNRGVLVAIDRVATGTDNLGVFVNGELKPFLHIAGERLEAPVYSPTGHVLFQRQVSGRGVWAVPFDLDRLEARGEPFLVAAEAAWPSVSNDGTLIHARADLATVRMQLAIVDPSGRDVQLVGEPAVALRAPQVSPDGRQIAVSGRDETGRRDVFVYDITSGARARLTFDADAVGPHWAGDHVVFVTQGGRTPDADIAVVPAQGGGTVRTIVKNGVDPAVSPDRRWLVFYRPVPGHGSDVFRLRLDPDTLSAAAGETEQPLLAGRWNERAPQVSPSGTMLSYESEETGRREVYVTTFPDAQGKWQVSNGGVEFSFWHPSGDRIFYIQAGRLYEVPVIAARSISTGTPHVVLDESETSGILSQLAHITPDGRAFVVVRRPHSDGEALNIITVVQNWYEEFRPAR